MRTKEDYQKALNRLSEHANEWVENAFLVKCGIINYEEVKTHWSDRFLLQELIDNYKENDHD